MSKKDRFIVILNVSIALLLSNTTIALTQTTSETSQSRQKPIADIEKLKPTPNPLSLPTQSDEVKLNIENPITLEQAIAISLKNNQDVIEAKLELERSLQFEKCDRLYFPI